MAEQVTTNSATTEDGLVQSSDYHLRSLFLITSDAQTIDLIPFMVELNIYEDIFSPTMSGTIVIGDALDLISNYKLHGNEFLNLVVDKPGLDKPITKIFRVYKISDREFGTASLQNFKLHFCSEELILSTQTVISKSYKGMTVDKMVDDILKNKLKVSPEKMKGLFTPTEGIFDIIIPKMQPFEAIQWLTSRSYSSTDSLYLFFENRDGFNFVSYENLLAQPVYQRYYKSPKIKVDPKQNIDSINFLKIVQDFDIIAANRYGAYSAQLLTFDFVNRQFKSKSIASTQNKLLNDNIPVNNSKNRLNSTLSESFDSLLKFYPSTDSNPLANPTHPENWLPQKATKLAQLSTFKIVMTIPGDVLVKAGMCVEIELPKATPQNDTGSEIDNMRSGKYLVSAVHHVFMNDIMSTVVELISDSITGTLNGAIDTSPVMQRIKTL